MPMISGMRAPRLFVAVAAAGLLAVGAGGCVSTSGGLAGPGYQDSDDRDEDRDAQVGKASFYAHKFHGRRTASGETYDETQFTAAHRTLPFGTRVRVTNLENGRKVTLRVNDRGPHVKNRVIDVSYAAARKLRFVRSGITRVRVEVKERPDEDDQEEDD
ncbi:MAG TPA: septal ring lytic transglycosylase RlpA family protein [Candidatus Eisenbacteria bacterium]|nr:septal ring lytic transglycosylase RlpA family protein [Candidatus Eisenbacteria bacterium]